MTARAFDGGMVRRTSPLALDPAGVELRQSSTDVVDLTVHALEPIHEVRRLRSSLRLIAQGGIEADEGSSSRWLLVSLAQL